MTVNISNIVVRLEGNWTRREMTDSNIDLLSVVLKQIGSAGQKSLRIDCGEINEVDNCGFQLLYVWLRYFRVRGIEWELINLPDKLQKTLQRLSSQISGTGERFDLPCQNLVSVNHSQRRSVNEYH